MAHSRAAMLFVTENKDLNFLLCKAAVEKAQARDVALRLTSPSNKRWKQA
jgi:Trk K+ transport system NAD-binding subunit